MNEYTVDLGEYELSILKTQDKALHEARYIRVSALIKRKDHAPDFKPIYFSKEVYEYKRLSKIIGSWEKRVEKTERKVVKRAKEIVGEMKKEQCSELEENTQ